GPTPWPAWLRGEPGDTRRRHVLRSGRRTGERGTAGRTGARRGRRQGSRPTVFGAATGIGPPDRSAAASQSVRTRRRPVRRAPRPAAGLLRCFPRVRSMASGLAPRLRPAHEARLGVRAADPAFADAGRCSRGRRCARGDSPVSPPRHPGRVAVTESVEIADPRTESEPFGWTGFFRTQGLHAVWDYELLRLEAWAARNPPLLLVARSGGEIIAGACVLVC